MLDKVHDAVQTVGKKSEDQMFCDTVILPGKLQPLDDTGDKNSDVCCNVNTALDDAHVLPEAESTTRNGSYKCEDRVSQCHDLRNHKPTVCETDFSDNLSKHLIAEQKISDKSASDRKSTEVCNETLKENISGSDARDKTSLEETHGRDKTSLEERNKCNVCNKYYSDSSLKAHIKIHIEGKQNTCLICSKTFTHASNLSRHIKTAHMTCELMKCHICKKTFSRSDNLQEHLQIHKTGSRKLLPPRAKTYKCVTCEKLFASQISLEIHNIKHTGEKSYKCSICGSTFKQPGHLGRHFRTAHTENSRSKCHLCEKTFSRSDTLREHLRMHKSGSVRSLPPRAKRHKCDTCSKLFASQKSLETHIRIHTGEKPYNCSVCGKSFNQSGHLRRHFRTAHTDYIRSKCHLCEKTFSGSDTLREHLKKHNAGKTFGKCKNEKQDSDQLELHEKTFSRLQVQLGKDGIKKCLRKCNNSVVSVTEQLEEGIDSADTGSGNSNEEEAKNHCNICGKGFSDARVLRLHRRLTHCNNVLNRSKAKKQVRQRCPKQLPSGLKKYSCDICGKSFAKSGILKAHVRTHTGEKPYKCSICSKAFGQKGHLGRHVRIHAKVSRHRCHICGETFERKDVLLLHHWNHTRQQTTLDQSVVRPSKGDQQCLENNKERENDKQTETAQIHNGTLGDVAIVEQNGSSLRKKSWECEICNKSFHVKSAKAHMRTHTGEKPYKCTVCEKKFSQMSHLLRHNKVHTRGDRIKCQLCGKTFAGKDCLLEHLKIHVKEKPYIDNNEFPDSHHKRIPERITEVHGVQQKCLPHSDDRHVDSGDKENSDPIIVNKNKCPYCDKHFSSSKCLRVHKRIHTGERPYKCDICGDSFNQIGQLHRHISSHIYTKRSQCHICNRTFQRSDTLAVHMWSHEGDKSCSKCGVTFHQADHLQRHLKICNQTEEHHDVNKSSDNISVDKYVYSGLRKKCPICHKAFNRMDTLTTHIKLHKGEKPHKCDTCGKGFARSYALQKHKVTHTGEKNFTCEECGKGFARSYALEEHKVTHTGEKNFTCEECGMGFCKSSSLKLHLQTHSDKHSYVCYVCGKAYAYLNSLKSHLQMHTEKKKYQCDICGRMLSTMHSLKYHLTTHYSGQEKSFKCHICNKAYRSKYGLSKHTKRHQGEKYKCNICTKVYRDLSSLKIHERIHTGEKFYCTFCRKGFCAKKSLKQHIRIHTGERPYECNICFKAFRHSANLRKHRNTHH